VLRIIGGAWRGRRLRFPDVADIRPTPDRVRETLFNWLGMRVVDARCLDLFAGSGALGLEALSRGAAEVIFVEKDATAARELQARLAEWSSNRGRIEHADALRYLQRSSATELPQPFEIVFLDPPFSSDLLVAASGLLESRGWLRPGALIYVETAAGHVPSGLPGSWVPSKAKQAGAVGYHLLTRA
jgi:16S rRNA (guanine966-N2)-methyltransferase